jgi:hypothetical protein
MYGRITTDPLVGYNQQLMSYCNHNLLNKLKNLINDERFNEIPLNCLRNALHLAKSKKHYEIAEVLISSPRVLKEAASRAENIKIPIEFLEKYLSLSIKENYYEIAKDLITSRPFKDFSIPILKETLGMAMEEDDKVFAQELRVVIADQEQALKNSNNDPGKPFKSENSLNCTGNTASSQKLRVVIVKANQEQALKNSNNNSGKPFKSENPVDFKKHAISVAFVASCLLGVNYLLSKK